MDKASIFQKNRRYSILAWVLALLVLAVAVPLNLIFDRINVNFDMTPNSLYTLTKTTRDYLDELDSRGEVVDVYFLATMEELENDLELLALYRTVLAYDAHDCFNLTAFDPDTNPEILKELNPDGVFNLTAGDFLFVHGDMVKRLPGKMLYAYELDENEKVIGAEFRAENYFTGYMKTVVDGELPVLYFLEGHNEVPLSDMTKLSANLQNYNYGAKQLNLTTAKAVPDDCRILVIASPKYDLTQDEFDKIMEYTRKGGHISVLMSPDNSDTAFRYLEQLLSSYCVGMNYDRVTETDESRHSHKEPYALMCDMVEADSTSMANLTADLLPTQTNTVTYMPESRSFYMVYGSNISTVSAEALIKTQTSAQSEPWGGVKLDPQTTTGKELALAMYAQDSERSDSKLAVFGSSYIITDEGTSNAFFINPLQLYLSTITWMYNSDVDMNIADKARTYDSLNINSSGEASGLIALFVGFPALVALAGVVIWLRRKDG